MSVSRYRQHERISDPFSSPVQRQVALEWVRLNRDPAAGLLLRRWATSYPALAGLNRPGDVVDAIDVGPPERKDELLVSLLEAFQNGQQLAGRILLQAMLPKLSHYAFRTGVAARLEARPEDRFQVVVCEFWEVLGAFPIQRRTSRVAANLALETLHRVTRLSRLPELPMAPDAMAGLVGSVTDPCGPGADARTAAGRLAQPDPDWDLATLLTWARAEGVLSHEDADLLRDIYTAPGSETVRDVSRAYRDRAAGSGVSVAALRQRVRRAKTRLACAVEQRRDIGA